MNRFFAGIAFGLILLSGSLVVAKESDSATHNLQLTREYYDALIDRTAPNLAELSLMMNMLPKGGDLHHHYSGAIYAETFLDWVGKRNNCIYRENSVDGGAQQYHIETRPRTELNSAAQAICMDVDWIRKNDDFYRALLMRWSDKDYDNHSHAAQPPDKQFFDTFGYFGPAAKDSYAMGLAILKARAKAENMQYLETQLYSPPYPGPNDGLNLLVEAINKLPSDATDSQIDQALEAMYKHLQGDADLQGRIKCYVSNIEDLAKGMDDEDFTLRFQIYVVRVMPPGNVFAGLYAAFAADHASREIVAVNFVAPENNYISMRDYTLHMKMFRFLRQKFPDVKVDLHAGELAIGMVPPEGLRFHIREAVEIGGASRIGHGVDIAYEDDAPQLLEELRKRDIPVEINLTSNAFILGVEGQAHPILIYRKHHVPFVISTDDAGVSRDDLSHEYLLYASRYKPSYDELKLTVYNSIRYAFLTDAEKRIELARLDKRFMAFEARIARLAGQ